MEKLTKEFSATIDGKPVKVKAIRIDDAKEPKGFYWLVPSSTVLQLLRQIGYEPIIDEVRTANGVVIVAMSSDDEIGQLITAYGSCLIAEGHGLDPVGIAMRRAVSNFAFLTGKFESVFDELRKLNEGTLDPAKSDTLNDSLQKYF